MLNNNNEIWRMHQILANSFDRDRECPSHRGEPANSMYNRSSSVNLNGGYKRGGTGNWYGGRRRN